MDSRREVRSLREAIDSIAQIQPGTVFLIGAETGTTVTFQDLKQQSILLCSMLRQAGVVIGDKVAFLMDNGLLTAQLFLGTIYGGFVAVSLNVRAGVVQLSYMLDHCDAKVVFVEEQYISLLNEALESVRRKIRIIPANVDGPLPAFESAVDNEMPLQLDADDVALLMYSSGSTGKPKAAIHTHGSVLAHGRNSIESHQLSSADRSLLVLPLYHINAECVTLIPTLLSGGSVVVAHRFAVSRFWDWIDDLHVTWSALVPTIISELVDWDDSRKDSRQAAFQRIRFLRSSSAPLSPSLHRRFLDKFDLPLLQAMGSTEGGNVFSNPVPPSKNKIGSPGLPWGFETRIVDRHGVDVAFGEAGEVLIRGRALMRGYYKDAEGTAAVVDSDGWLHTGDLARQDEDGYFFIVGRSKELIIKGGVNIAPRQIDEVLESHPSVLEAAAVGVPDRYFGEDAVAFVVLRPEVAANEGELLAFCETRLGHFKTPSRIHFLQQLPKGPSGKVQRLHLLDPAILAAVATTTQPESPSDKINDNGSHNNLRNSGLSIEQIIANAWAEVLAVPAVDRDANFFALGGHSLLAIQCLSKLRDKLPVVLSLSDFFEFNTVVDQAELVRKRLRPVNGAGLNHPSDEPTDWKESLLLQYVPPTSEDEIPRQDSTVPHPISPAQQRLWFLEKLNPGIPVYNEAEAVRMTGEINVDALERAMNVIVDRREVLRSTIRVSDGVPHAIIHDSWPLKFKKIDVSSLPPANREAEVERLLIDEPRIPYDLESEPGIRVALIRLSFREHVFILMTHHIICDWASEGIIWRELSALYRSFLNGEPLALPALKVTHLDYAAWRERTQATHPYDEDLAYWEETLRGAPALLELPSDRPRPAVMSHQGGRLRWKLGIGLTEALRRTGREEKTSLFTIFAAGLITLLYRYSGTDDISLGIPLADRDTPELQAVVGFLLHTHVLRTKLAADITFRELLSRVQRGVLDLYAHRAAPFDKIVQKLKVERNLSYSPLFQVMLNWRDRDQMLPFIGLEGLAIDSVMSSAATSKFDMLLFATDIGDEVWLELEYNSDIYDEGRIARMLIHFQTLLEGVTGDPGVRIAEVPLLTAEEYQQTVVQSNQTELSYSKSKCLDGLVQEQIERAPDSTALVFEGISLTYRQLGDRAGELAGYLTKMGVGRNTLVAICVERSLEMVVGLLGILKAGGAYLPLDPTFPPDRLAFMLKDAGPLLVLTQERFQSLLPGHQVQIICLDKLPATLEMCPKQLVDRQAEDLAYVIYTSGSTGTPKGVQIQHRALLNFLTYMRIEPGITAGDTLLAITTLSFDIAGLEIFLPLTSGARVVIASSEAARDGRRLSALIKDSRATIMQATPATWRMLLDSGWQGRPGLKILCGGESWDSELAGELLPRCLSLWNMYGPTETTIWSSATRVGGNKEVLIGKPIANTTFYILDGYGQPLPVGVAGELYIGGDGVSLGYRGRTDLTNERFISDPFSSRIGARLYKTGDLVRRISDGSIEFLGRIDNQVKLRGFRIELEEIEVKLREYPGVRDAVVIAREDKPGKKSLVAYYCAANEVGPIDPHELRSHLFARLPEYMIPAAFVKLESLPQTPNAKLDRKALPKPELDAYVAPNYEAPRGEVEKKLAAVWAEVLNLDRVGRNDNFFHLGGHSLLAVKMVARARQELRLEVGIRTLFGHPGLADLASTLESRTRAALPAARAEQRLPIAPKVITATGPHGHRIASKDNGGTWYDLQTGKVIE